MHLKWTDVAISDLAAIRDYIEADNSEVAQKVALGILSQAESLASHPRKGRPGRVRDTRESFVPNLPYFIVYRVRKEQLEILRVLHTSRRYP
jgi:addiction module RelE/StbE family toxin